MLQDRVAAALLAVGLVGCVVSGLGNRPVIVSETNETEEVGRELERTCSARATPSCAATSRRPTPTGSRATSGLPAP